MAKYLRTSSITAEVENLITEAKEKLYIISPYLKLSDQIKELLNDKEREKVDVRIIFGKQELNPSELEFLQSFQYIRLYFSKNLHAKCYLNENFMIISSMNLYEFSQQNNREMGILISKDNGDEKVYEDALRDIDSILHNAEDFAYRKVNKNKNGFNHQYNKNGSSNGKKGFCIRTGVEIPFNIERPLSYDAYKIWNEYGDMDYPEKFCHFSGEPSYGDTSYFKPILKKNWKKAQDVHKM